MHIPYAYGYSICICPYLTADLSKFLHLITKGQYVRLFWRRQLEIPAFSSHHHHILLCNPPGPSSPHGITMILNTWVNLDKATPSESYQMSDTTVILFPLASSLPEEVPWDTWGYHHKENDLTDVSLSTLILLSRWSITEEIRACLKKFRYYVNTFFNTYHHLQ